MLTALGQTADKVKGLRIGADDYVTKPFHMQELMARVEALLRRRGPAPVPAPAAPRNDVYHFGDVSIDLRGTEATRGGRRVNLSAREYQLLRYFIEHPAATLSREELLTEVWGYSGKMFTRTVDVHVAGLRQKLEPEPKAPRFFLTVQGLGYKFKPQ
jgi:two-component system alkaline phosphatase synthesis response regulator PhoP